MQTRAAAHNNIRRETCGRRFLTAFGMTKKRYRKRGMRNSRHPTVCHSERSEESHRYYCTAVEIPHCVRNDKPTVTLVFVIPSAARNLYRFIILSRPFVIPSNARNLIIIIAFPLEILHFVQNSLRLLRRTNKYYACLSFLPLKRLISTHTSAGVTPGTREACPTDKGLAALSFSRASSLSPSTAE